MIRALLGASVLLSGLASHVYAETKSECESRVNRACFAVEKNKPNSSRDGVDAATFCAMTAVVECSSR
jgi:hypothetical protein